MRHLFSEPHLDLPIEAIIAGHSKGTVWTDDAPCLCAALVWDQAHCYYFGGDETNSLFNDQLKKTLTDFVIPDSIARGRRVFKLYYSSKGWEDFLPTLFGGLKLSKRARSFYALSDFNLLDTDRYSREDVRIEQVRDIITRRARHGNVDCVCEEILSTWPTLDEFLSGGFGYCIIEENDIVCWCLSEYVSGHKCGIGIETLEQHQKRGFATLAATKFVNHCVSHGITPYWDSWADNIGSVRVAEKVGFRKTGEYAVFLGRFPDEWSGSS